VTLAVWEASFYQHSDIETRAHTFFGDKYTPPLVEIFVYGGPLDPICPAGDSCAPVDPYGYAGDGEVDEDIEMALAMAPAAKSILVYNIPLDDTSQTPLDEWTRIANDYRADVISSSWPVFCETTAPVGYLQAENILFEQMAAQGQSVLGGAVERLRSLQLHRCGRLFIGSDRRG